MSGAILVLAFGGEIIDVVDCFKLELKVYIEVISPAQIAGRDTMRSRFFMKGH